MKAISNRIISIINNTPWMFKYDEILHAFTPKRKHQMHGIIMWKHEEAIDTAIEWANEEKIPYFNFDHINTNLDSLRHYDLLGSAEWSEWHERIHDITKDMIHDAEIDFQPTYTGDSLCPTEIAEQQTEIEEQQQQIKQTMKEYQLVLI